MNPLCNWFRVQGHVVGEKLKKLSQFHQVVAITHLPQIAAYAQRHIAVRKMVLGQKTQTVSEVLEKETRVKELARMLGGINIHNDEPTQTSLKHAAELLSQSQ